MNASSLPLAPDKRSCPLKPNRTITVQLRRGLDPSMPKLKAEPLDGIGRAFTRVRILPGEHPVWGGAELSKDHVHVREDQ